MRLPYLRTRGRYSAVTRVLGGLCLTEDYRNGDLADGAGLTGEGDGITQRCAPRELGVYQSPQALLDTEYGLLLIAGGDVTLEGETLCSVTEGEKCAAVLGSVAVIFPDKVWIDLESRTFGPMETSLTAASAVFSDHTITAAGDAWPFEKGDGVTISGCGEHPENEQTLIVRGVEGSELLFDANVFTPGAETNVTVKRRVPDLEVLCAAGNRLWGVCGDTIYGSRLGDARNFFVYDGLSTDAYAVSTGQGGFTACAPYGSHLVFFRETSACKLYGSRPANFQLMTVRIPGVRRGCGRTLVSENEDLYYLGLEGLYVYSGGVPQLLSRVLGHIEAEAACGGVRRGKYYLCLPERVLEYDLLRRRFLPWGRERVRFAERRGGELLLMTEDGRLLSLEGGAGKEHWHALFRPFRDGPSRYREGSALVLDVTPEPGAWMAVDIRLRGEPWRQAAMFDGGSHGVRPVSLPPNREDTLELRLRGEGRCAVRSIERLFRMGSEVAP